MSTADPRHWALGELVACVNRMRAFGATDDLVVRGTTTDLESIGTMLLGYPALPDRLVGLPVEPDDLAPAGHLYVVDKRYCR